MWWHELDIRIPLSLEFRSVNLRGRKGWVIFCNKHHLPAPNLNTTAPYFLLMLHIECICARMTLVVQGPGWWRLHPDASFYNGYIRERANYALGHKYFYQKRHASLFAPIVLAKVSYMPHLTSKKNGELQSCDVLRQVREEEIEGKHTNGYKSHREAFRSISETIHSHNRHFPHHHHYIMS